MACDCITRLNEKLRPHNTRLALTIGFGGIGTVPSIGTEQIEKGRGQPPAVAMLPTFCPFCGTKYDDAEQSAAA